MKPRSQIGEVFGVVCLLLALLAARPARALDQFGDVSVDASAIYTGNTYHGYAEIRVLVENHSSDHARLVTLVYPDNNYANFGNSIGHISRSATVAAGAREIISLLQPPLPSPGDNNIRVEVDKRHEGEVHAPNANNHCNVNWRGVPAKPASVFVSRNLNFDAVDRAFQVSRGAYSAAMAIGPPDTSGGGGMQYAWMPDMRRGRGGTAWLELDYAKPQPVDTIAIHEGFIAPGSGGTIELIGVSGKTIAAVPINAARSSSIVRTTCPLTSEAIKTVRLNFTVVSGLAVDAVQISGPAGKQWAADARASSDNSAAAGGFRGADPAQSLRAESPISDWSDNWLAYTPFDCIVLGSKDVSSMPPAVQSALGDYLAAGGFIVLSGQSDLPSAWHFWRKGSLGGGVDYRVGFGRCVAFPMEDFSGFDASTSRALHQEARLHILYWQSLPAAGPLANAVLPIVANLKIPVRGIVIIMLGFVIVIGPVNIIALNHYQRRTWMLWTIPAISLATTMLVFVYSLLREGITPDTRIAGLTVIDQESHHAATIGGTAFYCPLTPSSGLHFDYGTEVTPLLQAEFTQGTTRDVDWTQDQQFRHGWLTARVPAYFHLRRSETRRERLQIIDAGGQWEIVNGLGAPIKSLWVASAKKEIYQAANVGAGEKASLSHMKGLNATNSQEPGIDGLLQKAGFGGQWDGLKDGPEKFLLPNTYIAVLEGSPFIENALGAAASAKRTTSSSIVFGFLGPADFK